MNIADKIDPHHAEGGRHLRHRHPLLPGSHSVRLCFRLRQQLPCGPGIPGALRHGDKTCCVVGFPLGAMSTAAKAFEARQAVADGAEEIDMVINIGAVKDQNWALAEDDIRAVGGKPPALRWSRSYWRPAC